MFYYRRRPMTAVDYFYVFIAFIIIVVPNVFLIASAVSLAFISYFVYRAAK